MIAGDLDLSKLLKFNPDDGLLQLGNQRNLLFSQEAFAKLRRLMHDQLGHELARSMLTRFGHQNGSDDFRTLNSMFEFQDEKERLAAGPVMHSWSGIVKVEPTLMEMDRAKGHFHFKGVWRNSYEAEIHLSEFGLSPYPVCYTLTGYGSGWCSEFFGMPLLEIETKCVACGDPYCEWEIRPFRAWGSEAEPWKKAMMGDQASISRQLEDQKRHVERLNAELESQVKVRTAQNERLLRILCHDLKAPLAVLKHVLGDFDENETLAKKADGNRYQRNVSAREACRAVEEIIRHVQITPAGVQNGDEALNLQEIALSDAIARTMRLFGSELSDKNVAVEIHNDASQDSRLLVDPSIFSNNILNNLFSNALKFSPRGGKISCRSWSDDSYSMIEIRDQGIGMPRHTIEKFNERNMVTSKRGLSGEKGSGLGLNLVRDFVEMHGGSMTMSSRTVLEDPREHGTSVLLRLPRLRKCAD